jgi:hypothetical protein
MLGKTSVGINLTEWVFFYRNFDFYVPAKVNNLQIP